MCAPADAGDQAGDCSQTRAAKLQKTVRAISLVLGSSLGVDTQAFEEQRHRSGRSTGKNHRTASEVVPRDHGKDSKDRRQSRISAEDPGEEPDRCAVEAEPDDRNHEQP